MKQPQKCQWCVAGLPLNKGGKGHMHYKDGRPFKLCEQPKIEANKLLAKK